MIHGELELLQLDQLGQRLRHRIYTAIETISHALSTIHCIEPDTTNSDMCAYPPGSWWIG